MASRWMQRTRLASGCAALTLSALAISAAAQQAADPYQGVAHPPSDAILTNESAPAKPSPATRLAPAAQSMPAASVASTAAPAPTSTDPSATFPVPVQPPNPQAKASADPDGDIVHPEATAETTAEAAPPAALVARASSAALADPDGDIVHPAVARPGEIAEGTMFQMELQERLTSTDNARGDRFHGKVLADVMRDGKVLIPAGSMVEGRISAISSGHLAGHGSMRLTPETLILPDSTRLALRAEVSGTPGSNHRIDDEGGIEPGSRKERAGLEYGAVAGAGAATGAVFAGPVGALAGGLVGAGMVTTHLMVSHPQVNLDAGTKILFTLTEPLNLMPAAHGAQ